MGTSVAGSNWLIGSYPQLRPAQPCPFSPHKPPRAGVAWRKRTMDKPTEDQIRQRAHELWEQSHRPDGRDDEFWNQAERELQEAEDRGNPAKEIPDDKNVIEKLADKINDAVENIVSTTADALDHAMQPEPLKPGEEAITFMRMAGDGFVSDPLTPP